MIVVVNKYIFNATKERQVLHNYAEVASKNKAIIVSRLNVSRPVNVVLHLTAIGKFRSGGEREGQSSRKSRIISLEKPQIGMKEH